MIGLIGYAAATCTTIAFLPQLLKGAAHPLDRRHLAGDGWSRGSLWLSCGMLIRDLPLIAATYGDAGAPGSDSALEAAVQVAVALAERLKGSRLSDDRLTVKDRVRNLPQT